MRTRERENERQESEQKKDKGLKREPRLILFSVIPGLLGGVLLELGRILEGGGSVAQAGMGNLLRSLIWGAVLSALLHVLLSRTCLKEICADGGKEIPVFRKKWFLITWLFLFVCWIPAFLAYYPTLWTYDANMQIPALRGMAPTTHHPLLHTLFLETIVQIGSRPGNYETGMALLSLIQMLLLSGMFAYGIEKARGWSCGRLCRGLMLCFFAFFPVHPILSVSMTKDVLFSGLWLICLLLLYDMLDGPEKFFHSVKKQVVFLIFVCLMLSFRSNAIYAFAAAALLGVLVFHRKYRKRLAVLCLAGICLYGGFQSVLYYAMGAEDGEPQEAYCVPMQCLVGTALRHPELIPEDETGQLLMGVVPRDLFSENLADNFDPHLADPVKERWRRMDPEDFEAGELIKTWISYGLKYPLDYIDIWGSLTLGAWYPFDTTHADIYEGERQGYLLTDFQKNSAMNMERPASKWPWMESLYEKIATENVHQKIPVISLLFAPAAYSWITFFCILQAVFRKKYGELLPLGMLFFYWGTIMLGPAALVRYLYPLIVSAPFMLGRIRRVRTCPSQAEAE